MERVICFVLSLVIGVSATGDYSVPPYGTKTAYYISFTEEEIRLLNNVVSFVPNVCTPIHVSASIRHGSRYPGMDDIQLLGTYCDRIRGQVQNPQFAGLNDTYVTFPIEDADELCDTGRIEMEQMAQRFGKKWRNLLKNTVESEKIYYSSHKSRAIESGEYFQIGLSEALNQNMTQDITVRNDLLRFYDYCPRYLVDIEDNPEALEEYYKFQKRHELADMRKSILEKLHLANGISFALS